MDKTLITDFLGSVSNIELTHDVYPLGEHESTYSPIKANVIVKVENKPQDFKEQYRFQKQNQNKTAFIIGSSLFLLLAYSALA
jgi:hypothetical protein